MGDLVEILIEQIHCVSSMYEAKNDIEEFDCFAVLDLNDLMVAP